MPVDGRLDPRYRVRPVPPDLVFFLADDDARCVRGEGWTRLAPHLEGPLTPDRLAAAADLTANEAAAAIAALARQGLLSDRLPARPGPSRDRRPRQAPEASTTSARPAASAATPTRAPNPAEAHGDAAASRAARPYRIEVEDYLDPALPRLAAELPPGAAWLPVKPTGRQIWLGPLFNGSETACPGCLTVALTRSRPVASLYYALRSKTEAAHAARTARIREPLAAAPDEGASRLRDEPTAAREQGSEALAVLERAVRTRLADSSLRDTLWVLDRETGEATAHALRREPDCACRGKRMTDATGSSDPSVASARSGPAILHLTGGGFRAEEPSVTRERLEGVVDPLTGWVREVHLREDDRGASVAVASYPHPVAPRSHAELRRRPRIAAAGKGSTPDEAFVGAVAEALERSSGVYRGTEPRRTATLEELGETAIRPDELLLYSERQVAEAARRTGTPGTLPADATVDWTAVRSLGNGRTRWLPATLAWYACPAPGSGWSHPADSNGCAAGSCREEAILQGLLELVERDAAALWWYNALERPRLDGESEASTGPIAARCAELGRKLLIFDLTSDLGVPVAGAVAVPERSTDRPLFGFGCHVDRAIAIRRALTEICQFLPDGDGVLSVDRAAAARTPEWLLAAAANDEPAAAGSPDDGRPRDGWSCSDFGEAIDLVLSRLADAGLEAFWMDQTRDADLLSVVRVVAPGLRPWYRRLAPGRLYDVPTARRWTQRTLDENDMEGTALYADPGRHR